MTIDDYFKRPDLEGMCPGHRKRTTFKHVNSTKGNALYECQNPHCQCIYSEEFLIKYNQQSIQNEVDGLLKDLPQSD